MTKLSINNTDLRTSSKRKYYWFQCECGNIVSRRSDSTAKHCSEANCSKATFKKHGKSESRLYNIWSGMRDRCVNGNHKSSIHYKEKGITICKEWDLFINFEKWALSNGYSDDLTIDRKDINGNYTPENCEWVKRKENTLRQNQDYHGHQKAIKMFNKDILLEFDSIMDCARYLITNKYTVSTVPKNVGTIITQVAKKTFKNSEAYGFNFEYIRKK